MQSLIGFTADELSALAEELGQPSYRGRQLMRHLYERNTCSFDEMTDLPLPLRNILSERYACDPPRIVRRDTAPDGTVKYLIELADAERIESVYLPYENRVSACLSTQAGCAAGCTFCATAQGGLARNLTAGEIVGQILALRADNPNRRITHAVFMGMGEPLMNYSATIGSIRLLAGEMAMSARNLTISTVGVAPAIRMLADEKLPITLALSLHAPDDELRERLIPTARKWKLDEILDACGEYFTKTRRNLTFEYLLLAGINDEPEQARALAARLKGLPGNVNLIPFNYVETEMGFRRPGTERIAAFRAALEQNGRITTQRAERGHAISAACGQLKRLSATTVLRRKQIVSSRATGAEQSKS